MIVEPLLLLLLLLLLLNNKDRNRNRNCSNEFPTGSSSTFCNATNESSMRSTLPPLVVVVVIAIAIVIVVLPILPVPIPILPTTFPS